MALSNEDVPKNPLKADNDQRDEISDDDNDDDDDGGNACSRGAKRLQVALYRVYQRHKGMFWNIFYVLLFGLYVAYFVYSVNFRFGDEGSWRLVVCTALAVLYISWCLLESFCGENVSLSHCWSKLETSSRKKIQHW